MWTGILHDDKDFAAGVGEMSTLFKPDSPEVDQNIDRENTPAEGTTHSATQNFAFAHNMPKFDVRSRLKEIIVPTLVIVGKHDLITPVAFSEEIANEIPKSELTIFEYSGHNPGQDEPEAFQQRIHEFLSYLGL